MSHINLQTDSFLQAIGKGDLETVRIMLQETPELLHLRETTGASPVLTAIYNGQQEVLQELLAQNISLDLFEAAAVGDLACVQEGVVKQPELVLAFRTDGFTALGLAAFLGHLPVVEYLLEHGADVNSVSKNQMKVMPLHSAVATRQVEIASVLLQKGAEVNAKQESGFTPLHEAALQGHVAMVELLVSHGADINAQTEDGQTPLSLAVGRKQEKVAELLQAQGAFA